MSEQKKEASVEVQDEIIMLEGMPILPGEFQRIMETAEKVDLREGPAVAEPIRPCIAAAECGGDHIQVGRHD